MDITKDKVLIVLIVLSVYLQMFAVDVKGQFGLSISLVLLFAFSMYFFVRNTSSVIGQYLPIIRSKKFFFLLGSIAVFLALNFMNTEVAALSYMLRLFRYVMVYTIIVLCVVLFKFISVKSALKMTVVVFAIGGVYGLYQFIAPSFHWPYFLNIFMTNPSFTEGKGFFSYYGGWTEGKARIYGVFSEPSFYGVFLALLSIYLIYDKANIRYKKLIFILLTLNIVLTFSRLAWLVFLFILFNTVFYKLVFERMKDKYKYVAFLFIMFLIPVSLYGVNWFFYTFVFSDLSMSGRFLSQQFYIQYLLNDGNLLFGEGPSSISNLFQGEYRPGRLEPYAHNAMVQILFEFGIVGFLLIFSPLLYLYNKYPTEIIYTITTSFWLALTFGEMYMIESITILVAMLYLYGINRKKSIQAYR